MGSNPVAVTYSTLVFLIFRYELAFVYIGVGDIGIRNSKLISIACRVTNVI